jgi:hypothetical protein
VSHDQVTLGANLTVVYENGEDGFWIATIPEVPGAVFQGKTKDEARETQLKPARVDGSAPRTCLAAAQ